jgi:hypothetical protein
MPRVVLGLDVAAFAADSTPFIGGGIAGAGLCIVSEEEASVALAVLYVGCGELYSARLPIHVAWDA